MSGKRPSLAESMRAVVAEPTPPPAPAPKASQPAEPPAKPAERPKGFYAATRAGKKKATASLSIEGHRQLKTLAVEQGGQIEGLLTEAINDLFRKHGKPPIA